MENQVLELFKVMVVADKAKTKDLNTSLVKNGIVTDFKPTASQKQLLLDSNPPLKLKTLFSRDEYKNSTPAQLVIKQLLHYFEVYGVNMPGLFGLEFDGGQEITMTFVRGVTSDELADMVRDLLYCNAPVKDTNQLASIIQHYKIDFDINQVANNELRVLLFDIKAHKFDSGDDAVRYICWRATESAMLIKSKEVIEAVILISHDIGWKAFLETHECQLAAVFNRHKKLIMSLKSRETRTVVNRISRLSKTLHKPLKESISKSWVSKAIAGTVDDAVIDKISVRDKFKYLNLLAYKRQGLTVDAFIVRNGKIHLEGNRAVWKTRDINRVEKLVLESLARDFADLKGKKILLDSRVRYGLPVSRKQAIGNLPFGTRVKSNTAAISSGVYWHDDGGASDLDLSTVDRAGNRVGWGGYSAYDNTGDVSYSGDVTSAYNGAMEFMTSSSSDYGLFINIFSGSTGCKMELVVGDDSNGSRWIDDIVVREKTTLPSRGMVLGFVKGNEFTVWQGRIGNNSVSGSGSAPYVSRGVAEFWTVNDMLEHIGITFDVVPDTDVEYDYDLSYAGFTFDKLEGLLLR